MSDLSAGKEKLGFTFIFEKRKATVDDVMDRTQHAAGSLAVVDEG